MPAGRPFLDMDEVLRRVLGELTGLSVVDIGCGTGGITRKLHAMGGAVVGLDPCAEAIEAATGQDRGPRYRVASAEATGLPADSVDLVVFSKSLHHVGKVEAALSEARRILRFGGRLAVIEPEAPDPFWPVMRLVDDEAPAYARVREALDRLASNTAMDASDTLQYATKFRVGTPETLLARMQAVDPTRHLCEEDRPAFEAAFAEALRKDQEGPYLVSWERVDVLEKTGER